MITAVVAFLAKLDTRTTSVTSEMIPRTKRILLNAIKFGYIKIENGSIIVDRIKEERSFNIKLSTKNKSIYLKLDNVKKIIQQSILLNHIKKQNKVEDSQRIATTAKNKKHLTRKEYVDFSMKMKPYIHPRVGGVTKLSMFTDGCGQYLKDCGYRAEFETLDGDKPYEEAEKFVKNAIERNLPVIYLMLRHRDKEFKDLNWHWFCITGYKTEKEEVQQRQIKNSCIHTASIQANEMNKNKIKESINFFP